jgi:hypothetical protein
LAARIGGGANSATRGPARLAWQGGGQGRPLGRAQRGQSIRVVAWKGPRRMRGMTRAGGNRKALWRATAESDMATAGRCRQGGEGERTCRCRTCAPAAAATTATGASAEADGGWRETSARDQIWPRGYAGPRLAGIQTRKQAAATRTNTSPSLTGRRHGRGAGASRRRRRNGPRATGLGQAGRTRSRA